MKSFLLAIAAVAGLSLLATDTASAQCYGGGYYGGSRYHSGVGYHGGGGYYRGGYGVGYRGYRQPIYHGGYYGGYGGFGPGYGGYYGRGFYGPGFGIQTRGFGLYIR